MPRSTAFACVYSSEAGAWSEVIMSNVTHEYVVKQPCGLAGDAIYFRCLSHVILKFNLTTRRISRIRLPGTIDPHDVVLAANQDGGLEFAKAVGSRLHLWSREANLLDDEDAGWTRRRVIELKTLLPTKALSTPIHVLGFAADGVDVIFVQTCDGIFTIYPKSDRVMKLEPFGRENESMRLSVGKILLYVNFYTPNFNRHI